MSPALRDPLRTLSRTSLRLIPNKIPATVCDVEHHSIARSETSFDGSSVVSFTRTPSNESNLSSETPNLSPEHDPPNQKKHSSAASVTSSTTDHSQGFPKCCQWIGCDTATDVAPGNLLSHIQKAHVSPQITSKNSKFICLWSGCKVYGHPSVSSNWLIRHVQEHSEAKGKPFSCIFGDCCQRFSSSILLERHIDRDHTRSRTLNSTKKSIPTRPRAKGFRKFIDGFKKPKQKVYKSNQNIRKCPVRHEDYVDTRSKIILQNRLFIDELLGKIQVMSRITRALDSNDESILPGTLRNGKHRDQYAPEKRILRSKSITNTLDDDSTSQRSDRVNPHHVRLLMTNPYIREGVDSPAPCIETVTDHWLIDSPLLLSVMLAINLNYFFCLWSQKRSFAALGCRNLSPHAHRIVQTALGFPQAPETMHPET
ncbi:hypothetical protein Aperf_G00000084523 [Anoplocephala perfoliata]